MSGLRFDAVRKPLELTPEQLAIIREVLERNHAYYMRNYDMPKPCMWPDELVAEIANALTHANAPDAEAQRLRQ